MRVRPPRGGGLGSPRRTYARTHRHIRAHTHAYPRICTHTYAHVDTCVGVRPDIRVCTWTYVDIRRDAHPGCSLHANFSRVTCALLVWCSRHEAGSPSSTHDPEPKTARQDPHEGEDFIFLPYRALPGFQGLCAIRGCGPLRFVHHGVSTKSR